MSDDNEDFVNDDRNKKVIRSMIEHAIQMWPEIVDHIHELETKNWEFSQKHDIWMDGKLSFHLKTAKMHLTIRKPDNPTEFLADVEVYTHCWITVDLDRHHPSTLYIDAGPFGVGDIDSPLVVVTVLDFMDNLHMESRSHLEEIKNLGIKRLKQYLETL